MCWSVLRWIRWYIFLPLVLVCLYRNVRWFPFKSASKYTGVFCLKSFVKSGMGMYGRIGGWNTVPIIMLPALVGISTAKRSEYNHHKFCEGCFFLSVLPCRLCVCLSYFSVCFVARDLQ